MFSYAIKIVLKGLMFLGIMALPTAVTAQEIGTFEGTVSRSGVILSNTQIVLSSEVLASYEAISYSDDQGNFYFSDVPIGIVKVSIFDNDGTKIGGETASVLLEGTVINISIE